MMGRMDMADADAPCRHYHKSIRGSWDSERMCSARTPFANLANELGWTAAHLINTTRTSRLPRQVRTPEQAMRRYLLRIFHQASALELAGSNRADLAIVIGGNLSVKPRGVHGVNHGIENHQVKMPNENGEGGQQRFVPMNGGGCIADPFGKMAQGEIIEPKQKPRDAPSPSFPT